MALLAPARPRQVQFRFMVDRSALVGLADRSKASIVSGIDDHSRFVVSARVVERATARPVVDALARVMRAHGVPEQILTDNGKVFTNRFGPGTGEVLLTRYGARTVSITS